MELDERGELPPHLHPAAEESYEVVSGELKVQVDGEWTTVSAGEKVVVPPNTEHAFKNTGPAEVINVHRPAMRFEEFFRRFHALKTERGVSMPPDGLGSSILLAMLVVEHEDEQRVVSPHTGRSNCWLVSVAYSGIAFPGDYPSEIGVCGLRRVRRDGHLVDTETFATPEREGPSCRYASAGATCRPSSPSHRVGRRRD